MRTRVVHFKKEPFDVYIGRPSVWGNPFSHKELTIARFRVDSRKDAISSFEEWVRNSDDADAQFIRKNAHLLLGKTLGCWCKPQACHGDVLVDLAENLTLF